MLSARYARRLGKMRLKALASSGAQHDNWSGGLDEIISVGHLLHVRSERTGAESNGESGRGLLCILNKGSGSILEMKPPSLVGLLQPV